MCAKKINSSSDSHVLPDLSQEVVSPAILSLHSLFNKQLSEVSFPGVSVASFSEQIQGVVDAFEHRQEVQQSLQDADETLQQMQVSLLTLAKQGLAYAQIFAQNDEALLEKLSTLNLGKIGKSEKKTKARKTKSAAKTKTKPELEQLALDTSKAGLEEEVLVAAEDVMPDESSTEAPVLDAAFMDTGSGDDTVKQDQT